MIQKPFLIYLADDDADDRELFKEALSEIETDVFIADFDNGVSLIDHLLNPQNRLPDVIYLDLNMPLMNGEECLDDIKNEQKLSKIPIIIYSTYVDEDTSDRLKNKGANGFLTKPSSFSELKNSLHSSLKYVYSNSQNPSSFQEFIIHTP